jgi:hypothetical protein
MEGERGTWKLRKPWIALAEEKICADNEYQVILHPDMICHAQEQSEKYI